MSHRILAHAVLAGTTFLTLSGAAYANAAIGLIGDRTLVMFDTETRTVDGMMEVSGVERLHGIDVRPADGWLYGIDSDANVVTIDLETGEAEIVSTLSETIPEGAMASVDFNPAADRLRFMGNDGTNLRIDVDTGDTTVDGRLHFDPEGEHADAEPNIVATAYTNSIGSPEETTMYDIDWDMLALIHQTAPNDGTLAVIGMLGIDTPESIAFDIFAEAVGSNTAYLVAGMVLHTVDLDTGEATEWGAIEGLDQPLRALAVLPAE